MIIQSQAHVNHDLKLKFSLKIKISLRPLLNTENANQSVVKTMVLPLCLWHVFRQSPRAYHWTTLLLLVIHSHETSQFKHFKILILY